MTVAAAVRKRTPGLGDTCAGRGYLVPVGMRGFEDRLERAVDATFTRLFRSTVKPVEFGRKLQREMDSNRSVGVSGRTIAPNWFRFEVSSEDYARLADFTHTLTRELADAAREHARDEGYAFVGPVEVSIEEQASARPGMLGIEARFAEGDGAGPPGTLLLPTGDRVPLGEYVVSIGRQHDCTIVLADPNVSRHHAEIRPSGDGYVVVDLGSTNGTRVNGDRIPGQHFLTDGDELRCGNTIMRFQAS